jgi:protein phosphatase
MINAYGVTDIGCVRERNEDRIFLDDSQGLYLIADGMGGHSHGEIAAELALTTVRCYVESSNDRHDVTWPFGYNFNLSIDANRLVTAVQLANRQVWKKAGEAPEYAGMGTTIAAVLGGDDRITVCNVGDSRIYLWRKRSLRQLTVDDTWIRAISGREVGQLDPATHPLRNFLTQSIGSKDEVEVHTSEIEPMKGDVVILTSDGLHGLVTETEIASILCAGTSAEATVSTLLNQAKSAGGPDNISVVLLSFS